MHSREHARCLDMLSSACCQSLIIATAARIVFQSSCREQVELFHWLCLFTNLFELNCCDLWKCWQWEHERHIYAFGFCWLDVAGEGAIEANMSHKGELSEVAAAKSVFSWLAILNEVIFSIHVSTHPPTTSYSVQVQVASTCSVVIQPNSFTWRRASMARSLFYRFHQTRDMSPLRPARARFASTW